VPIVPCWRNRLYHGEVRKSVPILEEAIRVMAVGERNPAGGYPLCPETAREALRGTCTTAVGVGIKSQVDSSGTVAQLLELADIELIPRGISARN
jgi:hypothetical protein